MTSIGFTCLITGQYSCTNAVYLKKLLQHCTLDEATVISSGDYSAVMAWLSTRSGGKTYRIKNSYATRYRRLFESPVCRLDVLFEECKADGHIWPPVPDIEFPKGRREGNETRTETAIREFVEEASVTKPFEIVLGPDEYSYSYKGINNRRYTNVYFTTVVSTETASALDVGTATRTNETFANHWLTFPQYQQLTAGSAMHRARWKILETYRNTLFANNAHSS